MPTNATAVQATLVAFDPAGAGYLRAWPTGTTEPGAADNEVDVALSDDNALERTGFDLTVTCL